MAMHMHQKYVPKNIDPFWYEDTFYSRPTRLKQGSGTRGLKLYEKLFGVQAVVRCEIEMKRKYLRRKGMKFPLTEINDPVANTLVFYEFDQKKFENYMSKNKLRRFREQPRSMQELIKKVKKKDQHWQKYFKPLHKWNEKFQQAVEIFNLEMAAEMDVIAGDSDDDGGDEEAQDDGYG